MGVIEAPARSVAKITVCPLVEGMAQRPRRVIGQALRSHIIVDSVLATQRGITFKIVAHLGGTINGFRWRDY